MTTLIRMLAIVFPLGISSTVLAQPPAGKGPKPDTTPTYTIHELHAQNGTANDVNATGEAVGTLTGGVPYYWNITSNENGVSVDSMQLSMSGTGTLRGSATGIANHICGIAEYDHPELFVQALVWTDPLSDPVVLPGGEGFVGNTVARAIGNNGLVVGFRFKFQDGAPLNHTAVAWAVKENGDIAGPLILGPGYATDVDEIGFQVVGTWAEDLSVHPGHAHYWTVQWDGVSLTAGDFAYPLIFDNEAEYSDGGVINTAAWVAGVMKSPDQPRSEAFLRDAWTLQFEDLPQLINNEDFYSENSFATGINNLSPPQVVGRARVIGVDSGALDWKPVMWDGFDAVDLQVAVGLGETRIPRNNPFYPGPDLRPNEANAINDDSWIVGQAARINGTSGSPPFVMIPITP